MIRKEMILALLVLLVAVPVVLAAVNSDPIAVAKISPTSCFACENETIWFDASDSYDDGYIIRYEWICNDKTIAEGMRVGVVNPFSQKASAYTVILRVTDDGGATDTVEVTFHVKSNPHPQIDELDWEIEEDCYDDDDRDFLVLGDNFTVEVNLKDEDDDHGRIIYNWDYPAEVFRKIRTWQSRDGEEQEVTFEVISDGIRWKTSYEISVTVSNSCGEGGVRKYIELEIKSSRSNTPPEAEITFLSSIVNEGESFRVSSAGSTTGQDRNEGGDEIVDWHWNITDERETVIETSDQENPQFGIEDSGIFIIHLKVTDRFGAIGETSIPFKVEEYENDKPVANASATKQTAIHGEPFELNGSYSWDPDEIIGGEEHSIGQYVWYVRIQLDDGKSILREIGRSKSSVYLTTFNRTGPQEIILEVRDTGDRVEEGDDEIEILSNTNVTWINVIEPPEPMPTVTPIPRLTPEPTPTPELRPMPTTTPTPPPQEKQKSFLGEIGEIWEIIIKALLG